MKAHEDLPVLVVHSKVITKAHEEFSILVVETKGARAFRRVSQSQQQYLVEKSGRAGGPIQYGGTTIKVRTLIEGL